MAGSQLGEINPNNEFSQCDPADFLTEIKLANQAVQTCREPPSTPACVGYANLLASSQVSDCHHQTPFRSSIGLTPV